MPEPLTAFQAGLTIKRIAAHGRHGNNYSDWQQENRSPALRHDRQEHRLASSVVKNHALTAFVRLGLFYVSWIKSFLCPAVRLNNGDIMHDDRGA